MFFAVVGMFAMICVLVQQMWRQWKRCRTCPNRLALTTTVQEPQHKQDVAAAVYGSSSRSSSSTLEGAQLVTRRGQDLRAVWAHTDVGAHVNARICRVFSV